MVKNTEQDFEKVSGTGLGKVAGKDFERIFGRNLEEAAEQVVLNEGDLNCDHPHLLYIDNASDGQAFWCDEVGCERHERMDYSPGHKIKFPVNALISTPNPEYGGEDFYAFRANADGMAELLDEKVEREVYQKR